MTPTQRTMALLKGLGYRSAIAEKWVPLGGRSGFRKDLYGFLDIVAIKASKPGVLGVQTTTGSNLAAHIHKIMNDEDIRFNAITWLKAGNRVELHGWRKAGSRGKRKTWSCRIKELTLTEVENA